MSTPPGPPDKKPGFLSSIRSAAREIAQEVKRDLNNQAPSGYTPTSAMPAASPQAAPPTGGPVGNAGPAALASFSFGPEPGEGGTAAPQPGAAPPAADALQHMLHNPWPYLRDTANTAKLRADAYYHPYTLADLEFYARDILPATDPEIVSVVAMEAGDNALLERLAQLAAASPGVYGSVGFNPRNLQPDLDAMDATLTTILNGNPHIIAVGPIGLDANYSTTTLPEQRAQFIRQLEIAEDFDLPAIIFHNKAVRELRDALENTVRPRRMVWLKPIRTPEELDLIQSFDAHVALRAELTHPKETFYQQAVPQLLPQRLLIGSGNSLNAAHNKPGQFNSSNSLPEIIKVASQLLGLTPQALQARTNTNFANLYAPHA